MLIVELIGWIGSIIYIISYFLIAYKFITKGKLYYLLNKIAAFLIIIISVYKNTFQPIVINVIWLYISYLGYHNKKINFNFLNKKSMHIISAILFSISFLLLIINYKLAFDIFAWFSVFAFSISYLLYSMNKIGDKVFHFYNFLAAISLIPKMILFGNFQVALLELIWGILALVAYIKTSRNKDYIILCS